MELLIDHEFKSWIMQLRSDEYQALKESILAYGCRDPLVVWNGTLIDGHNRYKICTENNIPFQVVEMSFNSREDVKDWIVLNQLARRNITQEQRDYLLGKMYSSQKQSKGKYDRNQVQQNTRQNDGYVTSEAIAKKFNVSSRTVERAERFTKSIDTLAENCGPDIRDKILSKQLAITRTDVVKIASMSSKDQKEVCIKIREGKNLRGAVDAMHGTPKKPCTKASMEDVLKIPCANPRCNGFVYTTIEQYKEMVGVFPEKFGHFSIPYCSKNCRDAQKLLIKTKVM